MGRLTENFMSPLASAELLASQQANNKSEKKVTTAGGPQIEDLTDSTADLSSIEASAMPLRNKYAAVTSGLFKAAGRLATFVASVPNKIVMGPGYYAQQKIKNRVILLAGIEIARDFLSREEKEDVLEHGKESKFYPVAKARVEDLEKVIASKTRGLAQVGEQLKKLKNDLSQLRNMLNKMRSYTEGLERMSASLQEKMEVLKQQGRDITPLKNLKDEIDQELAAAQEHVANIESFFNKTPWIQSNATLQQAYIEASLPNASSARSFQEAVKKMGQFHLRCFKFATKNKEFPFGRSVESGFAENDLRNKAKSFTSRIKGVSREVAEQAEIDQVRDKVEVLGKMLSPFAEYATCVGALEENKKELKQLEEDILDASQAYASIASDKRLMSDKAAQEDVPNWLAPLQEKRKECFEKQEILKLELQEKTKAISSFSLEKVEEQFAEIRKAVEAAVETRKRLALNLDKNGENKEARLEALLSYFIGDFPLQLKAAITEARSFPEGEEKRSYCKLLGEFASSQVEQLDQA